MFWMITFFFSECGRVPQCFLENMSTGHAWLVNILPASMLGTTTGLCGGAVSENVKAAHYAFEPFLFDSCHLIGKHRKRLTYMIRSNRLWRDFYLSCGLLAWFND